jgi:hypothetical protein
MIGKILKMGNQKLERSSKVLRLENFIKKFDECVRSKTKFSFVQYGSLFKIIWNSNAMALRSIMIGNGIIEKDDSRPYGYKWTEIGKNMSMLELIDFLIIKIDTYPNNLLDQVPNDVDGVNENDLSAKTFEKAQPKEIFKFVNDNEVIDPVIKLKTIPPLEPKQQTKTTDQIKKQQPNPERRMVAGELDEIEVEIILLGLNYIVLNEEKINVLLAQRLIKKLGG